MADLSQLERALVNADAAGDVDAARTLAGEIRRMRDASRPEAGMSVGNVARQLATGVPIIGGLLNKANAATYAALSPVFPGDTTVSQAESFGDRYSENLQREGAKDRAFETANPVTSTGLNIAGGVAGMVPALLAAPAAFGAGAGGLGARSAASALSGGGIGGADAAIRSDGDLQSTALGGILGGVLGGASPALAAGIGKGVTAFVDRVGGLSKPTGALAGLPRPAANYATDIVGDPARQVALKAELDRLGPQAMLADVSPEWMGVARGAASQPGMRDEIAMPLLTRDAAKNTRLRADMDAAIGPSPIPSRVDAGLQANQRALGPQYATAFDEAAPVNTQPLAETISADVVSMRGPAQRAAERVRAMLDVHGTPGTLDTNPATLFQTRQAIDGLMEGEVNPQVINTLTRYRQQVDGMLQEAVPRLKEVDAQFAELARQRQALTRGQQVLESGRTAPRPQELMEEVAQGALPQGLQVGPSAVPLRLRQGARAELDRVTGTNANDPAALQRLVRSEGDWNRDRLRTLFGPRADEVLGAIDRETAFYRTSGRVTSGSDTAMANRFGDFLDRAATPSRVPTDTTITGALLRGGQRVAQKALGSNAEANAQRFAKELGKLSVAQGDARDIIVQALLDSAQRRQSLDPVNRAATEIARLLLASSPPAANQRLTAR